MKKLLIPSLACLLAITFTGCTLGQQVPHTKLVINPYTHEVTLDNPKDTVISNFSATVSTNGVSSVTFTSLSTVMNPTNITNTGTAEAAVITATGQVIQQALASGGAAAGAAMGAAAKAP